MDQKYQNNMRACFGEALYHLMEENPDVVLLIGDLGYKIFDDMREDFPDRVINCGAAEQAMMGMAVGLSYGGKIPFVYSITPFLLYRPFETIRTYINYERLRVILVGSGRDKDYLHDGISHWADDDQMILEPLYAIDKRWPKNASDITTDFLKKLISKNRPVYINLKR